MAPNDSSEAAEGEQFDPSVAVTMENAEHAQKVNGTDSQETGGELASEQSNMSGSTPANDAGSFSEKSDAHGEAREQALSPSQVESQFFKNSSSPDDQALPDDGEMGMAGDNDAGQMDDQSGAEGQEAAPVGETGVSMSESGVEEQGAASPGETGVSMGASEGEGQGAASTGEVGVSMSDGGEGLSGSEGVGAQAVASQPVKLDMQQDANQATQRDLRSVPDAESRGDTPSNDSESEAFLQHAEELPSHYHEPVGGPHRGIEDSGEHVTARRGERSSLFKPRRMNRGEGFLDSSLSPQRRSGD